MHTRTKMTIWLVVLLLAGGALLGACGGRTTPSAPPTTVAAPAQAPATTAPATAVPTPTEAPATTAPTAEAEAPEATAAPTQAPAEPTEAPPEPTEIPAIEEPPAIDAAVLLQERCVGCHSLGRTTGARYTLEQWQQVVTRMIRHGAVLNAEEEAALVAYLAETYSP